MTTRATARHDLLGVLDPLGFRAGAIDLPAIWPGVAGWMRERAADVTPEGDERTFYLSRVPRDMGPSETPFAGEPPEGVPSAGLVCVELGRDFNNIIDKGTSLGLGSVGVALWYADDASWDVLDQMPGWIDLGPTTPHLDVFARGDDAEWLTSWIEESPFFVVAARRRALAAEVFDSAVEANLVVLAR